MPTRMTDQQLTDVCRSATIALGGTSFWRHVQSGGVYVSLGVTLRESDLRPLVRYYPHGKRGFEFCRPLDEFLERFEPTPPPTWTGTPLSER